MAGSLPRKPSLGPQVSLQHDIFDKQNQKTFRDASVAEHYADMTALFPPELRALEETPGCGEGTAYHGHWRRHRPNSAKAARAKHGLCRHRLFARNDRYMPNSVPWR
jgi:hypothetical protein